MNLLLVDDDPIFGRVMAGFCERAGLRLTYCRSVKEMEGIEMNGFDTVICDFELQNICGSHVIQALRSLNYSIPVLLVSAYRDLGSTLRSGPKVKFVCKEEGPRKILNEAVRLAKKRKEAL